GPTIRTLRDLLGCRPGPAEGTVQSLDRLSSALAQVCADGPHVIVLEDLHRADDMTLRAWNHLLSLAHRLPVLLVSTCSPLPYRESLSHLRESARRTGAEMVYLRPLSDADIIKLAADRLRATPAARLARYLRAVRGNPGAAVSLMTALDAAGLLERPAEAGDSAADHVDVAPEAENSSRILRDHALHDIPDDQRHILQVAALQRARFDATEVACAGDLPLPAVAAALANATDLGILRTEDDRLVFRMEAVRTACAQRLPSTERQRFHQAAALRLAAWGSRPQSVAYHLNAAGELPIQAIGWRAGLTEATLLSEPALFSTVLHMPPTDYRAPMLDYWLGDYDTALKTVLGLVDDVHADSTLLRLSVRALIRSGRYEEAAALPETTRDPHLGAWQAIALTASGDLTGARALIRDLAPPHGNMLAAAALVHACVATGWDIPTPADVVAARDALDDGGEASELRALLQADLVALLAQTGPAESLTAALADVTPDAAATPAWAAYLAGHWDTATELDPDVAAVIAMRRAKPEDAPATDRLPRADHISHEAEAIRAENAGRLEEALELRRQALAEALRTHPVALHGAEHVLRLAEATGAEADAAYAVAACAQAAADEGLPVQVAIAALVKAMAQHDIVSLLDATQACGEHGAILQQAHGLEQAAVWLADAGDRRGATRTLREAVTLYATAGATWDIARADTRLQERGVRRRTPADQPSSGWAALTPAECRVVRLVVMGLSDKAIAAELFLSQNTVHSHLARIRGKLGLRSRIDIARAVDFQVEKCEEAARPGRNAGLPG
ncbi:helix-turn-helix transcriptional regulator, partial [Catenulispora rubra]|uniref:helix-turn-helix transcriptional regulator n=1 Tax=Catenulispora rubra TaxID=280293 RepID=UPI001892715E